MLRAQPSATASRRRASFTLASCPATVSNAKVCLAPCNLVTLVKRAAFPSPVRDAMAYNPSGDRGRHTPRMSTLCARIMRLALSGPRKTTPCKDFVSAARFYAYTNERPVSYTETYHLSLWLAGAAFMFTLPSMQRTMHALSYR
eukprot:7631900-Pyramimonas_sp.AAC.2